ncbi:tol-pal system-associated acyl-CoA thioesterase [Aestuariivirga sp.]|uniref:tol-pal system-associated acyl-CoA thioesterase n=1 Tax=Aestuariivirga sp. TaxID=2650926 RepID=UPI0039E596BB
MTERLAGEFRDGAHWLPLRVYYEDTDAGGIVYHSNYLKYCERGRTDCLRLRGIHHSRLDGLAFVVRRMACDFLKPARLDDLLDVETRMIEVGGARVVLAQRVLKGLEALFTAEVTVALVDGAGRPRRLPKEMAGHLKLPL